MKSLKILCLFFALCLIGTTTNTTFAQYHNATKFNELEVAYPKFSPIDKSIYFTKGVIAQLSGNHKATIEAMQFLVDMGYDRKDAYDYLARSYDAEGMTEKAEQIRKLQEHRFPE